jgi:hypothetical protein
VRILIKPSLSWTIIISGLTGAVSLSFTRSSGSHLSGKDLPGHRCDPSAVNIKVGCDKKAQRKTGPVMDIAHQSKGEHKIRKPECPHKKGKFEQPGDETDQEHYAHTKIQTPSDNLHVHARHTLFMLSGYVV